MKTSQKTADSVHGIKHCAGRNIEFSASEKVTLRSRWKTQRILKLALICATPPRAQ